MNRIPLTALCACCAIFSSPVLAEPAHESHADHEHAEADSSKPAMSMKGTQPGKHADHAKMYTCPMHPSESNADKDAKCSICSMSLVPASDSHDMAMHADAEASSVRIGDPYLLNTCPISGEELGEMGDAIVKLYDGREVKFCCTMCVPKFEKDLKASLANLDQQIIESQLPFYPTTTCIVSGESLGDEEIGDPINFVYNNRLIRFCCKMCKGDFKKDPEAYIAKLDQAVIAQQSEHYPLTTCPISGEELGGEMGESIDVVYGGRLVKFCCTKCVEKFEADPMPTIEKIDAAWMAMHDGKGMDHTEMKDHDSDDGHGKDGHGKDGHGKDGHHGG